MGSQLAPGTVLSPGEALTAPSRPLQFILQTDGNLVLYRSAELPPKAVWATNTPGKKVDKAEMQQDGNFVVYGPTGAVWASNTAGHPGAWLDVQDDGNVVIYDANGKALWATNTVTDWPACGCASRLNPMEALFTSRELMAPTKPVRLALQPDGNLVVYRSGDKAMWATNTPGKKVDKALMQQDGNLVMYGPTGAVWASNTAGHPGAWLDVQDDGNVVIYNVKSKPLWATNTVVNWGKSAGRTLPASFDSGEVHPNGNPEWHMQTVVSVEADGRIRGTTRTWSTTVGPFGTGFHGAVTTLFSDGQGNVIHAIGPFNFGVSGGWDWTGPHDRTDNWTDQISADQMRALRQVVIVHAYDPKSIFITDIQHAVSGSPLLTAVLSGLAAGYQAMTKFFGVQPAGISVGYTRTYSGFVDTHSHQFGTLGFGGLALWGAAQGPVARALSHCTYAHGPGGARDFVGTLMHLVGGYEAGGAGIGHLVGGYPEFDGWPRWDSITHQSIHEDWLYRAVQGGLRMIVMCAVNNEWMCGLVNKAEGRGCSDMEAVDLQLDAAWEMQRSIDASCGGPGRGWYRIVQTPDEAMSVMSEGKLAVLLSAEVDYLFGLTPGMGDEATVRDNLDRYFDRGLRHFFPIHFQNNAFGGTAYQNRLTGDPEYDLHSWPNLTPFLEDAVFPSKLKTEDGKSWGYEYRGGRRNVLGLTDLGKFLVREAFARGMLIDVDHMSARARADALDIAESLNYPVVSGHTGFVEISRGEKRHEGQLLDSEVERIRALGGMVSVIIHQGKKDDIQTCRAARTVVDHSCGDTTETLAQAYLYATSKMPGQSIGIGTDLNGFAGSLGPRFGPEACPGGGPTTHPGQVPYPFTSAVTGQPMGKSVVGNKFFDYNVDGLAHIGLLPDMIADLQALGLSEADLVPLFTSAMGYVSVWARAWAARKVPARSKQ